MTTGQKKPRRGDTAGATMNSEDSQTGKGTTLTTHNDNHTATERMQFAYADLQADPRKVYAIFALCRVTLKHETDGMIRGYIPAYQHQPNTEPVVDMDARCLFGDGFGVLRDFNLVATPRHDDRMMVPVLKAVRKGDMLTPLDVYAHALHTDRTGAVARVLDGTLDRQAEVWSARQEQRARQTKRYEVAKKDARRAELAAAYEAAFPHLGALKTLGLAVVKADVKYHGHPVGVRDADGRGVKFTVACKVGGRNFKPGDVLKHTGLVKLANGGAK